MEHLAARRSAVRSWRWQNLVSGCSVTSNSHPSMSQTKSARYRPGGLSLHLLERDGDGIDRLINLLARDYEWRLHADHVAINASDADEHASGEAMVADSFGLGGGGGAFVILHQLDADHQAQT